MWNISEAYMRSFMQVAESFARRARLNWASTLERHEGELLHTSSEPDFGGVQISLTINGHVVHPLELARHATGAAEARALRAVGAVQHIDASVGAIGHVQEFLRCVVREHHVPDGAVGERQRLDAELLDELARRLEHLDAVVDSVANVDLAVVRKTHAMHRIAELP